MSNSKLTLVLEGDDDSIAWEILRFAGMSEDFPNADFALLDNSEIMDLAYKHADDWDEKVFDSGAPGHSRQVKARIPDSTGDWRRRLSRMTWSA